MKTLFPLYFSSSMLEDLHGCQLAWFNKHCRKLDMGEKSHHLIAGTLIASALEITRKEFYENNSSQEDSVEKGAEFLLEAEDTGDSRKSNENLEYVFRQYFRKFPLHTGWQPCKLENGNNAIEYKFRIDTGIAHPDLPERNIVITGKLDFLGEKVINNRLYRAVVDDKTTGGSSKIPGTDNIDLDNEKEDYENRGQFCLTEDHEVLTKYGWIKLKDYNFEKKLEIMCWDSGKMFWDYPYQKIVKNFEGELYSYSGQIEIIGTPEHRQVVFNRKLKKYQTFTLETLPLTKDKYQFIAGGKYNNDNDYWPNEDLLRLLVAFQADGCWSHDTTSVPVFSFSKIRKIERLREILTNLNITFSEIEYANESYASGKYTSFRIFVENRGIIQFLQQHLPDSKNFGDYLLDLSFEEMGLFINELTFWDGYIGKQGEKVYCSTNKNNIDWVQTICALIGKYGNIVENSNNKRNKAHSVCYNLNITDKLHKATNRQEKTTIKYAGEVYCLNVPSSYFLIRFKGKIMVTGNCAYHWAARKLGINTDLTVVRRIPILSKFEPAYELDIPITNHQLFWWENSTFQMIKILVEKYKMWKESGVAPQTFFYPTFSNSCTKWSKSSTYKMGEAHNFSGRGCAYKIGCMDKNGEKVLQMQGAQVVKYPESEKEMPLEEYLRTLK